MAPAFIRRRRLGPDHGTQYRAQPSSLLPEHFNFVVPTTGHVSSDEQSRTQDHWLPTQAQPLAVGLLHDALMQLLEDPPSGGARHPPASGTPVSGLPVSATLVSGAEAESGCPASEVEDVEASDDASEGTDVLAQEEAKQHTIRARILDARWSMVLSRYTEGRVKVNGHEIETDPPGGSLVPPGLLGAAQRRSRPPTARPASSAAASVAG
jgi:hypothetical protein